MISVPDHFAPDDESDVLDALAVALAQYDPASRTLLLAALRRAPKSTVSFGELARLLAHPSEWVTVVMTPNGRTTVHAADELTGDAAAVTALVTLAARRCDTLGVGDRERVAFLHQCAARFDRAATEWGGG